MPVLKRKTDSAEADEWYIHIPNQNGGNPPVYTIQVEDAGRDMLLSMDLDHDASDNRAADIDWDLFYTLDDLSLLYTYGDEYDPGDAIPKSTSFEQFEGLSADQRAAFAHSLLDEYDFEALFEHQHIVSFFQSLADLPNVERDRMLDEVLSETPFTAPALAPASASPPYGEITSESAETTTEEGLNSMVFGVFIAFVYNHLHENPAAYNTVKETTEGRPIWVWDDWVAFAGSELMFYGIDEELEATIPQPVIDCLMEEVEIPITRFYNLLEYEFSAVCIAQIINVMAGQNATLGQLIRAGFDKSYTNTGIILPRPSNHEVDVPGKALTEAMQKDAKSSRAKAISQMMEGIREEDE